MDDGITASERGVGLARVGQVGHEGCEGARGVGVRGGCAARRNDVDRQHRPPACEELIADVLSQAPGASCDGHLLGHACFGGAQGARCALRRQGSPRRIVLTRRRSRGMQYRTYLGIMILVLGAIARFVARSDPAEVGRPQPQIIHVATVRPGGAGTAQSTWCGRVRTGPCL
jgi:hypothetical protein